MGIGFGNGFDFGFFGIMGTIFPLIFIVVLAFILFTAFKGIKQWSYNNKQPVLTVNAKLVSKRIDVKHRSSHHNENVSHSSHTYYYATFEVESGDRMEFDLNGQDYGMLAEGDEGRLTFQGTRFLGFQRARLEQPIL